MTTEVAVLKGGQVVMAADSLVTFGDTRLSHRSEANQKLLIVNYAGCQIIFVVAGCASILVVI